MSGARTGTIGRRLMVGLTTVIALSSLLSVVLFAVIGLRSGEVRLRSETAESARSLASMLDPPLWDLDLDRAELLGEAFASDARVVRITIREPVHGDTRVIVRTAATDTVSVRQAVLHQGSEVGEVTLSFDRAIYRTQIVKRMRIAVAVSFIALVASLVGMRLLLRRLLEKPLAELSTLVGHYAAGDYRAPQHVIGQGELQAFSAVLNDMGNRIVGQLRDLQEGNTRLASEVLVRQEAEEQYRAVFDGVRDVIFAASPEGVVTSLNEPFETITGWRREEWLGKPFVGLLHPDDVGEAVTLLRAVVLDAPRPPTSQFRVRTRDGGIIVGEFRTSVKLKDGKALGVFGIVRDITERLRLEEQLRHSQKMEAIGQLAGGVAHDFNNFLTAIIGYGELLLADLPPGDARRADVQEITNVAGRAARLTRQLLAFSRRQVLQPSVLSLNAVLSDAEELLRQLIGEDVTLMSRLEPDLWSMRADAGQLEQVIINLAVNARDAMPDGGTLSIETSNVEVPPSANPAAPGSPPPGAYVVLSVRDTGTGMDPETKARIFEPFFTTKPESKGTGLGLSTVYGITQQSGGFITVTSAPGQGAWFSVYFPRVAADAAPVRGPVARATLPRGTETILLAEDQSEVRAVMSKVLRRQGYTVLEAADGRSALDAAAKADGKIALLISDVVMPGQMSGPELAEQLSAQGLRLRVLFMSGYADNALLRHGVLEPGINFLQKPYTPEALAMKVREILDAPLVPWPPN